MATSGKELEHAAGVNLVVWLAHHPAANGHDCIRRQDESFGVDVRSRPRLAKREPLGKAPRRFAGFWRLIKVARRNEVRRDAGLRQKFSTPWAGAGEHQRR